MPRRHLVDDLGDRRAVGLVVEVTGAEVVRDEVLGQVAGRLPALVAAESAVDDPNLDAQPRQAGALPAGCVRRLHLFAVHGVEHVSQRCPDEKGGRRPRERGERPDGHECSCEAGCLTLDDASTPNDGPSELQRGSAAALDHYANPRAADDEAAPVRLSRGGENAGIRSTGDAGDAGIELRAGRSLLLQLRRPDAGECAVGRGPRRRRHDHCKRDSGDGDDRTGPSAWLEDPWDDGKRGPRGPL